MYTPEQIMAVMAAKGYVVFDDARGYDVNVFGIRTSDDDGNDFNDVVGVMYVSHGRWVCFQFPATTDPGVYWRQHPMNVAGTAILVPGQYRGAYKLGQHKGYEALQQAKPLRVYRDSDSDEELDFDVPVQTGMFGVNIHRASSKAVSSAVDRWSAGCQVIADPLHFRFLIEICKEAAKLYGNSFTYTLLTDKDFD